MGIYALLTGDEQILLRLLAMFTGAFSTSGTIDVMRDAWPADYRVIDALSGLAA